MVVLGSVIKDPDAVLDYAVDWATWLAWDGDTIAASTWTLPADPDDLAIDSFPFSATVATVWLSGGQAGRSYLVTNHITTAAGREDERTLRIRVVER